MLSTVVHRIINMILGVKVIEHNVAGISLPDDLSYPFKLEARLRAPEFMMMTFIAMHGGIERITARGRTKQALERFVRKHDLRNHPRLQQMTITGPDGVVLEQIGRQTRAVAKTSPKMSWEEFLKDDGHNVGAILSLVKTIVREEFPNLKELDVPSEAPFILAAFRKRHPKTPMTEREIISYLTR